MVNNRDIDIENDFVLDLLNGDIDDNRYKVSDHGNVYEIVKEEEQEKEVKMEQDKNDCDNDEDEAIEESSIVYISKYRH